MPDVTRERKGKRRKGEERRRKETKGEERGPHFTVTTLREEHGDHPYRVEVLFAELVWNFLRYQGK